MSLRSCWQLTDQDGGYKLACNRATLHTGVVMFAVWKDLNHGLNFLEALPIARKQQCMRPTMPLYRQWRCIRVPLHLRVAPRQSLLVVLPQVLAVYDGPAPIRLLQPELVHLLKGNVLLWPAIRSTMYVCNWANDLTTQY